MRNCRDSQLDGIVKISGCFESASSLVTATYVQVRLIPQDARASPADIFTMPSQMGHFLTSYDVIMLVSAAQSL